MTIKVKTCGLSTKEAVLAAQESGADYLGFIFFERSPRHVTPAQAATFANLAPHIPAVAVTVDMEDAGFEELFSQFKPTYLQLHGTESPTRVAEIKHRFALPVIKAILVQNGDDIAKAHAYEDIADILMFDAKAPANVPGTLPGGNGLNFDWHLLADRKFTKPWFLSGGLNGDNVHDAVHISGAKLVDASSSLEIAPGVKSPELIQSFVAAVKKITG